MVALAGCTSTGNKQENQFTLEAFLGASFVDCTAYGDLAVYAGAEFTVPNDDASCNSIGLGNVDMDEYYAVLQKHEAIGQLARGLRSRQTDMLVRLSGINVNLGVVWLEPIS